MKVGLYAGWAMIVIGTIGILAGFVAFGFMAVTGHYPFIIIGVGAALAGSMALLNGRAKLREVKQ